MCPRGCSNKKVLHIPETESQEEEKDEEEEEEEREENDEGNVRSLRQKRGVCKQNYKKVKMFIGEARWDRQRQAKINLEKTERQTQRREEDYAIKCG